MQVHTIEYCNPFPFPVCSTPYRTGSTEPTARLVAERNLPS